MEPKNLQGKLESLDLTKVSGIQWNQEHTWSRLNAQLQLTKNNRGVIWYYSIAASIVLLIAFISGHVSINNSEMAQKEKQNELAINDIDPKEQECTNQVPTSSQPITKNVELKSIKIVVNKTKSVTQIVNAEPDPKTSISENIEKIAILDTAHNIGNIDLEKINEIITAKELIADINYQDEIKAKYSEYDNVLLSSKPIKQEKNKLSIKLFQRENKRKLNNARSFPALTLFASN